MDRRQYTPTKSSKLYNQPSYARPPPSDNKASVSDLSALKEYESLKIQVRQLQNQNRTLTGEIQKLKYEKSYNESKYLQKMNFEEETINQFQKEKNYQLEMLQIKNEEELNKLRRDYEVQIDELHHEIKNKDYNLRERAEQVSYLELRNNELKKELDVVERELVKSRDSNSLLNEKLTKEEFANKKLEMLANELERQKTEMEAEIHVLLDIEAQKSRTINALEIELKNAENVERSLQDKLAVLTQNFANLEQHISVMKERLLNADASNVQLDRKSQNLDHMLRDTQLLVAEQKDRELKLRDELQQYQGREMRRQREVTELMDENQRLYRELNKTRHQLHELCISQGIDF